MNEVLYVYPMWHTVSFTLIARKHIQYMRDVCNYRVYEIDELTFPNFVPSMKHKCIIHPLFFIMHRVLQTRVDLYGKFRREYFDWWRSNYDQLIGVDVADSDAISDYAVSLANLVDKVVLPSKFAIEVYRRCGVKAKLYHVPHGVDPEWYSIPNLWECGLLAGVDPALLQTYLFKEKRKLKILLFWLWHSGERKGWPEVRELYTRLRRERKDVVLVLKTALPNVAEVQEVIDLGCINIYGWLNERSKMALYDLADVTLVFSRGGSFELNALESLARGTPVVTSDYGPWTEYVPSWLQVPRAERVKVLPGNKIHIGYGYKIDVEKALDKVHDILENLDDYRARVLEYRDRHLKFIYRWDVVAKMLVRVIED